MVVPARIRFGVIFGLVRQARELKVFEVLSFVGFFLSTAKLAWIGSDNPIRCCRGPPGG